MSHQSIQPENLFPSAQFGFSQVVVSRGQRMIHCAGQTAWDKEMNLIGGGDLRAQMEASLENVRIALAAAGAEPWDVVSLRIYIVDYSPESVEILGPVLTSFFGSEHLPANTLIGVQALALPEFLCEIEATAVVGD